MNILALTIGSLMLFAGIAHSNDIVREDAVIICNVQGEIIRFDYFKETYDGSKNYIAARGLDSEGNERGNCEYWGGEESEGMTQFKPNVKPLDNGSLYCPGAHHPKYKIGIFLIDSILLAKNTPKGTVGRILINLKDRKIIGTSGHYLSNRDTCIRY